MLRRISKPLSVNQPLKKSEYIDTKIFDNIEDNKSFLRTVLGDNEDFIIRSFKVAKIDFMVCFLKGLVDTKLIGEEIISNLINHKKAFEDKYDDELYGVIKDCVIYSSEINETNRMDEAILAILSGNATLFIEGIDSVIDISIMGFESRDVQEPHTESLVRGPREGFTENILVNIALLRRRIKSHHLTMEKMTLGIQTKTTITIVYMKQIANPKLMEEVRKRLDRIKDKADAILESSYIEEFIQDNPKSIFPTIGNSERPDAVAAKLLDGKIAILCDGTPFVLVLPNTFIENFQHSEDYYIGPYIASCFRILRLLAYTLTITLPALYIAVTSYHFEMIPTILLITMAASREGIPLPSSLEAFFMVVIFEIIREAGTRMPKPVGQAISIVGALVLGQAAVEAGIVSSPMIIIVAITGITTFVNPSLVNLSFILRVYFMLLAMGLGLYGVLIGLFFLLAHMCALRSFGVPYFSPIAPVIVKDLKDSIIRAPLWAMTTRPESITHKNNSIKQSPGLKPQTKKKRSDNNE